MTSIEIEGLEELLKILNKELPQKIEPTAQRAMQKSVKQVEGWAKRNAPVDTGLLRSSIGSQVHTMFGEIQGMIGSPVRYAAKVEEPGPVRKTGRRPYLRPAVSEHVTEIIDNFHRAFTKLFASIKR